MAYGWLPNPQHEATKFFNTILPGMFQAAFCTLGEKPLTFYFRKERQVRFDEQRSMHSCQARMKTLLADRPGMLGPYLLPPSTSIPSDVRILRNGLLALRVLQEEISGHISTLKARQGPFYEKNGQSPLPWATEEHCYFSSAIEEWHMIAQEISAALAKLQTSQEKLNVRHAGQSTTKAKDRSEEQRKRTNEKPRSASVIGTFRLQNR